MASTIPISEVLARVCADAWEMEATLAHPAFGRHLRYNALVLEGFTAGDRPLSVHPTYYFEPFDLNIATATLSGGGSGRLVVSHVGIPDDECYFRLLQQIVAAVRSDINARWRDDVLAKVDEGLMSPDAADALAKQYGYPPFQTFPGVNVLDEPYWTLGMARAQGLSRDLSMVAQMSPDWLAGAQCWTQNGNGGWYIAHTTRTGSIAEADVHVLLKAAGRPPFIAPEDFDDEWSRTLLSNDLHLIGTNEQGDREAIPDLELIDIGVAHRDGKEVLTNGRKTWTDPRAGRDAVLGKWPVDADSAEPHKPLASRSVEAIERLHASDDLNAEPRGLSHQGKIRRALLELQAAGAPIDSLRPVERRRRLSDCMKKWGLDDSEIPNEREWRRFFNGK